eukprot:COSAG05_NODE_2487_length_3000_cov_5.221648_3_plen_95_part_00
MENCKVQSKGVGGWGKEPEALASAAASSPRWLAWKCSGRTTNEKIFQNIPLDEDLVEISIKHVCVPLKNIIARHYVMITDHCHRQERFIIRPSY